MLSVAFNSASDELKISQSDEATANFTKNRRTIKAVRWKEKKRENGDKVAYQQEREKKLLIPFFAVCSVQAHV